MVLVVATRIIYPALKTKKDPRVDRPRNDGEKKRKLRRPEGCKRSEMVASGLELCGEGSRKMFMNLSTIRMPEVHYGAPPQLLYSTPTDAIS